MSAVGRKEIIKMNRTASQIKGVFDTMQTQLSILETEIKREEQDKISFEIRLKNLNDTRNDLLKSIEHKRAWVDNAETGNFAQAYQEIEKDIEKIYNKAKAGHRSGIKILGRCVRIICIHKTILGIILIFFKYVSLEKEFNYHPTFKRPGDTFTSSAFVPK